MVARQMSLSVTPYDQTTKVRARRLAAQRVSHEKGFFDRSNTSVMYDHRYLDQQLRNPQGMIQRPCTLCGDCITGCNVGAKNTLLMNYLPIAKHNGTEFYTQCEVESIEKKDGYYRLNIVYIEQSEKSQEITRHKVSINSEMVVVGAGSPGSPSILLNSQREEFNFSPALGYNWSGNGDTIGFVIDMPGPTNIGGYGAYDDASCRPGVGPTVQTSLNYYSNQELYRRLLIQDAAIPRGVSNLFTLLLGDKNLDKSMVMLGMGHDGANGRIIKKAGRFQVVWPGLEESDYRKMVFGEFERLAAAHGGRYKRLKAFGNNLVTVHPLGGCGMADDPKFGTTNHLGQVYDGKCISDCFDQAAVHHGLYVADGSVIPTALGVNPYMSIGAVSERIANHIVNNPIHSDLFDPKPSS
jgi:cholesterol oxidase